MATIFFQFSKDRSHAGEVVLIDDRGGHLAGPFTACARADSSDAIAHDNANRNPLHRFGDTPCGNYEMVIAVPTGEGTLYAERAYGPVGALILKPVSGDCLRAASNGRLGLMIHGGEPVAEGGLRATNGSIRLANGDMATLLRHLARISAGGESILCKVVEADISCSVPVELSGDDRIGDPPPGIQQFLSDSGLSRRSLLKGLATAGITLSAATGLALPSRHSGMHDRASHDRDTGKQPHDRSSPKD